jgi:hypothetical protein
LILPLDLLLNSGNYANGRLVMPFVWILGLVGLFVLSRRWAFYLVGAGLVYIGFWWVSSPQARYLLPLLATLSAVGGVAVARLADLRAVGRAIAAACLIVTGVLWIRAEYPPIASHRFPAALGFQSEADYVQESTGTYDALHRLKRRSTGPVAFVQYSKILYYPGESIAFGRPLFPDALPPETLLRRLRAEGIDNLIVLRGPHPLNRIREIRDCIEPIASERARDVLNPFTDVSVPIGLDLYSLDRCYRELDAST